MTANLLLLRPETGLISIMNITKRQQWILEIVVNDYIQLVEPISSHYIETNYDLGVSPATIRNDMKELIEKGYLAQPYTSAGRVPTDKGYRYFVNKLLKKKRELENRRVARQIKNLERQVDNEIKFLRELTGFLATLSNSLTYSYLSDNDFFWKEGLEETFYDPEFEDVAKIHSFLSLVKEFEKRFIKDFSHNLKDKEVKIYIGRECPLANDDFSILVAKYSLSQEKRGYIALLGPKRMAYDKNISLINSLVKLLEKGYDKRK